MDYVNSHSAEEIAKTIQPQFKETPVDKLAVIVGRYKDRIPGRMTPYSRKKALSFWKTFWKRQANCRHVFPMKTL